MTDIIDLIDQATGCQLDSCGRSLGASPSGDFCSPWCQQAWHEERADLFPGYTSAERGDGLGTFRYRVTRADFAPTHSISSGPGVLGISPEGGQEPVVQLPYQGLESVIADPRFLVEASIGGRLRDGAIEEFGLSGIRVATVEGTGERVIQAPWLSQDEFVTLWSRACEIARAAGMSLAEAWNGACAAVLGANDDLRRFAAAWEESAARVRPTDPRERALELRRNRNTGPARRNRPPRTIKPGGCS